MAKPTAAEILASVRKREKAQQTPQAHTEWPDATPDAAPAPLNLDSVPAVIRPIVQAVLPFVSQSDPLPEGKLRALIDNAVVRLVPAGRSLTVQQGERPAVKIDLAHKLLGRLTQLVNRQTWMPQAVFVFGPAGSAKTTAFEQVAAVLGLEHRIQPVHAEMTVASLIGYISPVTGVYHRTPLRDAYEYGYLYGLDEMDACRNAAILVACNSLISQSTYQFPDGVVKKHPNFRLIAGGNTAGTGATGTYQGRVALDGATLNRFTTLQWGYDTDLERAIAVHYASKHPAYVDETHRALALRWADRVAAWRTASDKAGTGSIYIRSPRQVMAGAVALMDDDTFEQAEADLLWAGVTPEDRDRIASHL